MRPDTRWLLMPHLVAGSTFLYALLFSLERGASWLNGAASPANPGRVFPSDVILLGFAALYGCGRATTFHAAFNNRYQKWLEGAPWHPGMPLPLGPVQLEARDLLVLAPLAGLAHLASGMPPLVPLLVFAACYLLPLLAPLTGKGWWAFSLTVGFAGVLRAAPHLPIMAGLLAAMLVVARVGLKHSLPRPAGKSVDAPSAAGLGVPFEQLAPVAPPKPIPLAHAVAYAALAGWWAYCLFASCWTDVKRHDVLIAMSSVGALIAFGRFCAYALGSEAPLGLRGRWVARRWIVPGYDQILVAPMVVSLAAAALPWLLANVIASVAVVAGLSGAVFLLLALALPPTRARWLLTGHRGIPRRPTGGEGKVIRVTA